LGIYIQINYYCIPHGVLDSKARFCYKLLKNEWVHFLGTDSHGADGRAPYAKAAVKIIKKRYGEDTVRKLLWDNPLTMLENKHLR
jgi:protein-tyrosine phosphatase